MNIALVSMHNEAYQELGNITWNQNKVVYAQLHGYSHFCKVENLQKVPNGYDKIHFLKELMITYTELDWLWWTGCDSMITNFTIKIEDRVDNNFHLIMSPDCHGLNADSILIRNSPEGREYLDYIIKVLPDYENDQWYEQQAMIDSLNLEKYKKIAKIVPQKLINAYDYWLYPECCPIDKLGEFGQWQYGDFLIHWPGTFLPHRLQLAQKYLTTIIR